MSGKKDRPTILYIESKDDGAQFIRIMIIFYFSIIGFILFANYYRNTIENIFVFIGFLFVIFIILISILLFRIKYRSSKLFEEIINIRFGLLINPITSFLLTLLVFIVGPILITFDTDIIEYFGPSVFIFIMVLVHLFALSFLPEIVFGIRSMVKTKSIEGDEG